ncbi:ABC transporter ATP-binding protein [Paenibacillus contaminans]|nr:ABC transporter ATP-binding protein [Paenibacillus contaminans]
MRGEGMMSGGGYGGGGMGGRKGLSPGDRPKAKLKDVSLTRIFGLFRSYWQLLLAILALALLGAVIGLVPPLVMRDIVDNAIPQGDRERLLLAIGLMVGLPLISGLLGVWQNHMNNKVGQGVMRDLRRGLFRNLQKQSMSFFTHSRSGEVIQRLTGDVQAVQGVVTGTIVNAITQMVIMATTLIILFRLDWRLALISIVILPLFVIPVRSVSRARKKLQAETQKVRAEMAAELGETFGVSGAMLTRIFGKESAQEARFAELNEKVMALELRLNLVGRWFGLVVGVLAPTGAAIIYLYGGIGVMDGSMSIGDIIAFTAYVGRLYGPTSTLLNLHVEVSTALGVFQRIYEYMDMKSDIVDAPDAKPLPPLTGHIAYRGVSFEYKPGQTALENISFSVRPGQLMALVGPSGAGKSTLIGMMARLHDPTDGAVEMDGHDLRQVTLQSLREQVAFVTQESFLFHETIRENMRFAKEDATDGEIEDACRKAYIHDLIAGLPEGYDTMVGERGHRLSGGERQRLAIARAILRNPRVLVLDEATSHLDSESEAYVQTALEELMQGRTTIVIAHRLSTVLAADSIITLENGRIAEQGTHAELLAKEGLYAKLYHTQFAKVEEQGAAYEADRLQANGQGD